MSALVRDASRNATLMPIFYGSSQVMDSSLHEDDSLQSGWPLGINLVSMDHDGDLTDSTLVVLQHDPLIVDASDDVPKSDLFGVARLASNSTHEEPKETKPIVVTTSIAINEEPVAPSAAKVSHFVNGKHFKLRSSCVDFLMNLWIDGPDRAGNNKPVH